MLVSATFAQRQEGVIMKASVDPVIDGVIDSVWSEANEYNISRNMQTEVPTLGDEGDTNWKALWTDDGFYVLIEVADDQHLPFYLTESTRHWEYDKIEIYFDVNYILEDELGPRGGEGHYQVGPGMHDVNLIDGTPTTGEDGVVFAYKVTNPQYVAEVFIPYSKLLDRDGIQVDLSGEIGFDVIVVDRDTEEGGRNRAVWSNEGTVIEPYTNMDECGIITLDGAEPLVYIDEITLSGGPITVDNETLQIDAAFVPENATTQAVKWLVATPEGSTGRANISSEGVLTPLLDGVVTVTAEALDGSYAYATLDVTISGQIPAKWELNIIKNGVLDDVNEDGTATWWEAWGGNAVSPIPMVVDGVAVCTPISAGNASQYQWYQRYLSAVPNIDYVYSFKAWAEADRTINANFADIQANGWNRYGASTDPESKEGRSEWICDITTVPTMYTFHVNFDEIVESTIQKAAFNLGISGEKVYIDSLLLISVADLDLVTTGIAQERSKGSFKVYPNPAVSQLHIDISYVNAKVAIYNSIGVKMEETVVSGTHHVFDVSNYKKGLYFIKANNAVMKFIK